MILAFADRVWMVVGSTVKQKVTVTRSPPCLVVASWFNLVMDREGEVVCQTIEGGDVCCVWLIIKTIGEGGGIFHSH